MKKYYHLGLAIVLFLLFMASCQYKFIVQPEPPPPPEDTISFKNDLLPIWNDGDYCTACHTTGATAPDLTPENAYNSIMATTGVVDLADPPSSLLYEYPSPSNTTDHTWKKYKTGDDAIVLKWIEQGALNN